MYYLSLSSYLEELTGATGHDLLDLRISAVRTPLDCVPICGAEVRFLDLLAPHRWCPGWGPCSEQALLPLPLNRVSLLTRSCSNLAASSFWTSKVVDVDIINLSLRTNFSLFFLYIYIYTRNRQHWTGYWIMIAGGMIDYLYKVYFINTLFVVMSIRFWYFTCTFTEIYWKVRININTYHTIFSRKTYKESL